MVFTVNYTILNLPIIKKELLKLVLNFNNSFYFFILITFNDAGWLTGYNKKFWIRRPDNY